MSKVRSRTKKQDDQVIHEFVAKPMIKVFGKTETVQH
jgi:hypothetical protein